MADPVSEGVTQTGAAVARRLGEDLFRERLSVSAEEVEAAPQKFGPGRRKGSRNRSSDDLARLVQQIGGHPVLAMARIVGMSIEEIRGMLGCNRVEAFDRWATMLERLAPYVASKQPLAVAVSGKVVALNMTVPMGDGAQLLGPDGVAALFAAARRQAEQDGFVLPAPNMESQDETEG